MRARAAVLGMVLVAALAACSDDGDEPGASATTPTAEASDITTVDCAEFAGTSSKLAEAQQSLYNGDNAQRAAAVGELTATLKALKPDAPAEVDDAIDTLVTGFAQAASLMDDPASADTSQLAELAPELSDAGQKVTAYVLKQCG